MRPAQVVSRLARQQHPLLRMPSPSSTSACLVVSGRQTRPSLPGQRLCFRRFQSSSPPAPSTPPSMTTPTPKYSAGSDQAAMEAELHSLQRQPGSTAWKLVQDGEAIERTFKFKTFAKAWVCPWSPFLARPLSPSPHLSMSPGSILAILPRATLPPYLVTVKPCRGILLFTSSPILSSSYTPRIYIYTCHRIYPSVNNTPPPIRIRSEPGCSFI